MIYKFSEILTIKNGKNQKKIENPFGKYPIYGSGGIIGYGNDYICDKNTIIIGRKGNINKPLYVEEPFWNVDTAFGLVANINILFPKYLYYFCVKYNFEKLNTTVTIPSLTKTNLLDIKINLPDLSEQKKISNILDKILKILEIKKQQFSELDKLVKFQFLKIFGDPILNEKNWKKIFLSDCCIINPKKNEIKLDDNFSLSFIGMADVSEKGKINTSNIKLYKEVKNGFTYFKENDVLFAKITPCMENGKGGIAKNLYNKIGFGSTEFHVLRPIENISNSYWLYCLTMLPFFRKNAEKNMTGSAGQKRVPITYFQKTLIALPPIELQNKFADFVKQVDKSKFELQKSIDETQLLFDSLMDKYFG